jgi:hypothetical protein
MTTYNDFIGSLQRKKLGSFIGAALTPLEFGLSTATTADEGDIRVLSKACDKTRTE